MAVVPRFLQPQVCPHR